MSTLVIKAAFHPAALGLVQEDAQVVLATITNMLGSSTCSGDTPDVIVGNVRSLLTKHWPSLDVEAAVEHADPTNLLEMDYDSETGTFREAASRLVLMVTPSDYGVYMNKYGSRYYQ
jgi:hypothetical protein